MDVWIGLGWAGMGWASVAVRREAGLAGLARDWTGIAGIRARRSHGLGWAGGVLWFGPARPAWSAFCLSFLNIFVCVYVFITLSFKKIYVVNIQLAFFFFFAAFVNFLCEIRTFFYRSFLWGF